MVNMGVLYGNAVYSQVDRLTGGVDGMDRILFVVRAAGVAGDGVVVEGGAVE